ncbi:TPA: hypothetical protein N0F65_011832 [Lagenidium giganteum]|uniref:Uncharacterized protein n=1 Tax=Lagenidium giganteum TaxID=4803 RepID=A0AAV2Z2F4_9STRA|nr:TPA: hypothetical protein N0F65_011832 [Lagenidium giganteum]
MPMLDDLREAYDGLMWLFSLDAGAREYTAFVCPLGHFEWLSMPQVFKNSPQLYQQMMDNALWGFVKLSLGKHVQVIDVFVHGVPDEDDLLPRFQSLSFANDIKSQANSVQECIRQVDIVLPQMSHWKNRMDNQTR